MNNGMQEGQNWFIKQSQLLPLGITEQHVYFIVGLLGILICYYFLSPLIRLLLALKWDRLITYIMGSLLLLTVVGLFTINSGYQNDRLVPIAHVSLAIIFYGIVLFVVHLCQSIIAHIKHNKSKST